MFRAKWTVKFYFHTIPSIEWRHPDHLSDVWASRSDSCRHQYLCKMDCFSIMHSGFVASTVSKNQYAVCQTAFAWRSRAAFEDGCETVYDKAYVILAWICFALLYVSVCCANVSKWCAVVHSYSLELFHLYWKYILAVSWQALSLNIKLEAKDTFVEFQLRQYCIIWMIIDITYVYFCIEETWERVSVLAVC